MIALRGKVKQFYCKLCMCNVNKGEGNFTKKQFITFS